MMNVFIELDSKGTVVKHFIFSTDSEKQIPERLRYVRPPRDDHRAIVLRNVIPNDLPADALMNDKGMIILDIAHEAAKNHTGDHVKLVKEIHGEQQGYLPSMDPSYSILLQRYNR